MKKLLFISFYFPPLAGGGVYRPLKFVKYLPDFGWEPIVLTIRPNDIKSYVKDYSLLEEIPEGVKIYRAFYPDLTRLPLFRGTPARIFFTPFRNKFLIPANELTWNIFAYRKAAKIISTDNPDLILTTSPPHSVHLLGMKLKKSFNIPWVADMRDEWTTDPYMAEAFVKLPENRRRREKQLERQTLNYADGVVAISTLMKRSLVEKIPLDEGKVKIIPNGFDEEDFADYDFSPPPKGDKLKILLMGNLSLQKVSRNLIPALEGLIEGGAISRDKIQIDVYTQSNPSHINKHFKNPKNNIFTFHKYLRHREMIRVMSGYHAFLLLINPDAKSVISGRIFEYIRGGRPVIGFIPEDGEAAEIIKRTRSGWFCSSADIPAMKSLLQVIHRRWRDNKWDFNPDRKGIERYDRRRLTGELSLFLNGFIAGVKAEIRDSV